MSFRERCNMTMEQLLSLAYEVKAAFEDTMTKIYPEYMEGPRAQELFEMIAEIKSGKMKDHFYFDFSAGMGSDELLDYPDVLSKAHEFNVAFMTKEMELRPRRNVAVVGSVFLIFNFCSVPRLPQ